MSVNAQPVQKNFFDVYARCRHLLTSADYETRMSVLLTFFWTQMNQLGQADMLENGLPMPMRRVEISTPQTYIFDSQGPLLITVRGTDVSFPKNILADITGRLPRVYLKARTRDKLRLATPEVAALIEAKLDTMRPENGEVLVQAGLFLYAVRCLVHTVRALETLSVRPGSGRSIHLYGHSLGAACASFLYAWMRDLGYDVTCSCLSCPRLCNDAGYQLWFAAHDTDRYRHYYTRGDPVVHGIPKTAGLTRHVSMTYYVAPLVHLPWTHRLLSPLIAHVTFQLSRFRRVVKSRSKKPDAGQTPAEGLPLIGPSCFRNGNILLTSLASQGILEYMRQQSQSSVSVSVPVPRHVRISGTSGRGDDGPARSRRHGTVPVR